MKKELAIVTDDRYKDSRTIPLIFRFEPLASQEMQERINRWSATHVVIDGKDLYLFDGFFTEKEAEKMRTFSNGATFSREIFASKESIQKGQKPTRSMNGKEKWDFFANPPEPVKEFYKLVSFFSDQMKVDITTFPWDLVHGDVCSPAVATNLVREHSTENMELDKHRDVDLENKGIAFAIPVLYAKEKTYFPNCFVNGEMGKPWLVSAMIYSTGENFLPDYGMGTVFYKDNGEMAFRADCIHMRIVLFEGDIIHSVEHSKLPPGVSAERVSYVFKLAMNPTRIDQSVKGLFRHLLEG